MSSRPILTWILCLAAVSAIALYAPAPTAECAVPTQMSLEVRAIRHGDRFVMMVTGNAPSAGAWLGRSVYAYNVRNKATDGLHVVERVTGNFTRTYTIPIASVNGGSYEVAMWATKIPSAQCTISNDPWCRRNGFHLAGLLSYKGGWLPR